MAIAWVKAIQPKLLAKKRNSLDGLLSHLLSKFHKVWIAADVVRLIIARNDIFKVISIKK